MSEQLRDILTLIGILPIDRNKVGRARSFPTFSFDKEKNRKGREELFKLLKKW
jgi:hypothetical protein